MSNYLSQFHSLSHKTMVTENRFIGDVCIALFQFSGQWSQHEFGGEPHDHRMLPQEEYYASQVLHICQGHSTPVDEIGHFHTRHRQNSFSGTALQFLDLRTSLWIIFYKFIKRSVRIHKFLSPLFSWFCNYSCFLFWRYAFSYYLIMVLPILIYFIELSPIVFVSLILRLFAYVVNRCKARTIFLTLIYKILFVGYVHD